MALVTGLCWRNFTSNCANAPKSFRYSPDTKYS